MRITERTYADTLVLSPAGRLDHDSCDAFEAVLKPFVERASAGHALVLDLSALDYVSSAGLRLLMLAGKRAKEQGGRVMIAAMQPLVAEIFYISRFTMLFEIYPGVREALSAVSPASAAAFDRG
jgi:anti-sigma B factor antagonist